MARSSLLKEFFEFIKENKKWWLIPIVLVLGLVALLVILANTIPATAPFIYTIF